MSLDLLKSNIGREKEIVSELSMFSNQLEQVNRGEGDANDRALLESSINNLTKQLGIVNNAIPGVLENVKFYRKLKPVDEVKGNGKKAKAQAKDKGVKGLMKVEYKHPKKLEGNIELAVKTKDKMKFLESVTLSKDAAEKLKKKELKLESMPHDSKARHIFVRLSNKYYRETAEKLTEKGYFKTINRDLRKITSPFLLNSYVSMMFLSINIALIFSVLFATILLIFRQWLAGIIVLFALPFVVFLLFLNYPSSQRGNLEKEINQELPFVTIYMAAVATSGIEPSKIFSIIVKTKDYFYTRREIKKLLNYINFYGYDLVSALRYSSKNCPSERLAMLFNGLGTTIRSGGELSEFLSKHAETLLFDYRLEREKYTKIAETFMDIYISIVIAAPMIMMILFVLLTLTGYASSFLTPGVLSILIIAIVSALNIGFIIFLNIRQPKF